MLFVGVVEVVDVPLPPELEAEVDVGLAGVPEIVALTHTPI